MSDAALSDLRDAVLGVAPRCAVVGRGHAARGRRPGRRARPSRCARPPASSRYEPADMTVTVLAGHDGRGARRRRWPSTARSARSIPRLRRRDRRRRARVRALRARAGCGSDRCATGCSRCASSPATAASCGAAGPTVKNVTGYDLPRLLVGSLGTLGVIVQVTLRTQPPPDARRSGRRATTAPAALRARLFRPSCLAWDGRRTHVLLEGHPDDIAAEQRSGRARPVADRAGVARRAAPGPDLGRARRARGAGRPAATTSTAAGSPRAASAPCTSRPSTEAGARRGPRRRRGRGRLAAARGRRPGLDRSASRSPNLRGACARHQGRVRPRRQAQPRAAPVRAERRGVNARARRGRARRLRGVRAVPARVPDLPGHRARDRVAARADRRDAGGAARRRADRRRVRRGDGRVRGVPRLRGRVPVVGAVRPPDGRAPAPRSQPTALRGRGGPPSGSATGSCSRATRCSSRSRGCSRSRSGCASCRGGSGCRSSRSGRCAPRSSPTPTRTRSCSPAA